MLEFCRAALGRVPAIGDGMKYEYYSKEILKDNSLTDATKCVANHLIHIAGWEKDNLIPSVSSLTKILSIDKSSVSKALKTLKERGIIIVNDDNTFTFQINGIKFDKQDLKKPDVCHMFGDFVKVPQFLNYVDVINPSSRIAAIMFFDFNFDLDKKGNPVVKRKIVRESSVATYYGINKKTFASRLQNCKKAQVLDYKTVKSGNEETLILNAKFYEWERIWARVNSLVAKKSIKLAEEAVKEETYEGIGENKAVLTGSSIEQLLDYEAKKLSDGQAYFGCFVAGVKGYLSDMIEIKGEEYAINYMKEHWPKIDLNKVLNSQVK